MQQPAVTWWGHSSMTIALGTAVVATDPLLTDRLYHLRRQAPSPTAEAAVADVVLVSHLHYDHLHLPSLARFAPGTPIVVPRGAADVVKGLSAHVLVEVVPGDRVNVAGVDVEVLAAHHPGSRSRFERGSAVPAVGFRFSDHATSVWYPGDTGARPDFADVAPVDLAAVPIGGWGPSLGQEHLDPEQAVAAVDAVGARWALAVHYGTFWPLWLKRLRPLNHRRLFETPPQRFLQAARARGLSAIALVPDFGERVELSGSIVGGRGLTGPHEQSRRFRLGLPRGSAS